MIFFPARGQKMIIKNINNHRWPLPELRAQAILALCHDRMTIRIRINLTVKNNSFSNAFWKISELIASHRICNKIADHQILVLSGQVDMCKVIHSV